MLIELFFLATLICNIFGMGCPVHPSEYSHSVNMTNIVGGAGGFSASGNQQTHSICSGQGCLQYKTSDLINNTISADSNGVPILKPRKDTNAIPITVIGVYPIGQGIVQRDFVYNPNSTSCHFTKTSFDGNHFDCVQPLEKDRYYGGGAGFVVVKVE